MRTREETTLSSLAQLGGIDPTKAVALLDQTQVQPEDFGASKAIALAVVTMLRTGRSPEVFAVAEMSKASRASVAALLVSGSPGNWQPLKQQLESLRELAKRRAMIQTLDSTRKVLSDLSIDYGAAISDAISALNGAAEQRGIRKASEELFGLVDHVEQIYQGTKPPVLETGLAELDSTIGGLQPTLTVIGSLPGVGKSALLATIIGSLAARGVKCGLLSLEDEAQWLVRRLVAQKASIPVFILSNRKLYEEQMKSFDTATEGMFNPLESVLIDDRSGLNTSDVVASARAMVTQGAKAIFVDHLGEIRLERSDRHDLDVADALQQLRALAKVHKVPVVVLCHLKRRDGAESEPRLTDFAFSAGVERMARVAIGLTRAPDGPLKVHVLKQTQGVCAELELAFDGPSGMVRG